MKKSDIYEIAIKILGLFLFLTSITIIKEIAGTFMLYFQLRNEPEIMGQYGSAYIISVFVQLFVVLAFASFLTFGTKIIAKKVCKPNDYEESVKLFTDKKDIYEIAFVIIGLLTIVLSLPSLLVDIKTFVQLKNNQMEFIDRDYINFLYRISEIMIGIIIIYFSNSLAILFAKKK